jgi:phosphonate transport system substrate-binding protein
MLKQGISRLLRFGLIPLVLLLGSLVSQATEQKLDPVVLAVHPYLPLQELKKRFQPLADYLRSRLAREVVVRIGPDYAEHIAYIGMNKVDIAYMGPATYVRMVARYGMKPLLARLEINGKPVFHGYLVSRQASAVRDLPSLRGRRFAFGDPGSTMSHLVPRYMMLEAGIDVRDLADYQFLGSHVNVALAVLAGAFDAGAVKEEVMVAYAAAGLRPIAKSKPFSEHLFVARSDAPADFIQAVSSAMLRLNESSEGQAILQGIKQNATGLVAVEDRDYDNLRAVLNVLQQHGVE